SPARAAPRAPRRPGAARRAGSPAPWDRPRSAARCGARSRTRGSRTRSRPRGCPSGSAFRPRAPPRSSRRAARAAAAAGARRQRGIATDAEVRAVGARGVAGERFAAELERPAHVPVLRAAAVAERELALLVRGRAAEEEVAVVALLDAAHRELAVAEADRAPA